MSEGGAPIDGRRRRFVGGVLATAAAAIASAAPPRTAIAREPASVPFGGGELLLPSDGTMRLPIDLLVAESVPSAERDAFLAAADISAPTLARPLNLTLWRDGERTVLFDVGSGPSFLDGTGELPSSLEGAGVDPGEITDVVFTHAHPDHLWGVLDDFDELVFAEARYHMHARELDYWMAEDTLAATPEARQAFVVGARNRLPLIAERLERFSGGEEVLPGVEAVDTHGHTPGHTSFVLHADGEDPVVVLGDALLHPLFSFARPSWPSGADQDQDAAIATRLALLDRLAGDRARAIGYHLPAPGLGRVERADDGAYRWVAR